MSFKHSLKNSFPLFLILLYVPFTLFFGYLHLGDYSPRNYLLLILFFLTVVFINKDGFWQIIKNKYVIILTISLAYVLTFSMFVYKDPLVLLAKILMKNYVLQIVLLIATIMFVKNKKQIKLLNDVLIFSMLISCIVAIGQFFNISAFWWIRRAILPEIVSLPRIAGLSYFNIQLAYQIVFIFPIALMAYHCYKKKVYLFSCLIIFLAGVLSCSRSCWISMLVVLLLYAWKFRYDLPVNVFKLKYLFGFLALVLLLFSVFPFRPVGISGRVSLVAYSFYVVWHEPFGVGPFHYFDRAWEFRQKIKDLAYESYFVERYTSHNQFLLIMVYYGLPVLCLLLLCTFFMLRDSFLVCFGLFLGFVGFVVNSCFHNGGLFLGDPLVFLLLGEVVVLLQYRDLYTVKFCL